MKSEKREVAEQLYVLYNEAIKAAVPSRSPTKPPQKMVCKKCDLWFFTNSYQTFCESCRKRKTTKGQSFDDADKTARRAFMHAAQSCIDLGADPRDFIVAQFAMWRAASAYHKKLLLPQPSSLASLAARVRYIQHKGNAEVRTSRKPPEAEGGKHRFFAEERLLRGLARMQRRDPIEVLTELPEQFSSEFLRHKGVWGVVRDLWEERQHS